MKLNAAIFLLLGATNIESQSKFVPSPYATINDNRGSTAVAQSPYATTINDNRGSTAVAPRKLSKKNTLVSKEIAIAKESIEGSYYYLGSCNGIYKVNINCGTFGKPNNIDDRDLCIYEEYNVGAIIGEEEGVEIPAEATALDNGLLYVPKDGTHYKDKDRISYEKEGSNIDRNEVCVLSGTFRHSSTVVRSGLLPIPLAKSNGCNKPTSQSCCANADTQNFQFVVKASILDNGDLDIGVSSNYGYTYYTDNMSTVPQELKEIMYVAKKVVVENGRRELWLCLGTVIALSLRGVALVAIAVTVAVGVGIYCAVTD